MIKKNPFLLFDLGGVLIELDFMPRLLKWMDHKKTPEQITDLWLHSQSVRQYEAGKISEEEFAERIIPEFGFNIHPEEFLNGFYSIPKGFYKGTAELIASLKENYPVGCLSNTNRMHWKRMRDELRLHELVPICLLSFETGYMKPDKEAFLDAAQRIGCEPHEIIYFDDNPTNVRQANAIGFKAFCVTGNELVSKLKELGILP